MEIKEKDLLLKLMVRLSMSLKLQNGSYVIDHFEFIYYITVFCVQALIKHEKICDIIKSVLEAPDYSGCAIKVTVHPLI